MSKKLTLLFLIVFLGGLFFPLVSLAGEYQADGRIIHYEGLVPCGKSQAGPGEDPEVTMPCQFCHFFVMIDGILDFLFVFIVPPIAALMLVVGGIMFYLAGGNPQLMTQARNLIKYAVIGLVVIYGAYLIIGTVLTMVGVEEWTTLDKWLSEGVFNINCPIELP